MWQPTEEEVAELIAVAGEKATAKRKQHYEELAPKLYDAACNYANRSFEVTENGDRLQRSAVFLFIAKAAQYYEQTVGLTSRRMGSVSYSFTSEMPKTIYDPLKPFRKVRW